VSADVLDEIIAIVRLNLSESEADSLLGWIALRTGRQKALARGAETLERLRHALEHWLTEAERRRLLAWLSRRVSLGDSPLPRRTPRR
jgi:hypothetical protein